MRPLERYSFNPNLSSKNPASRIDITNIAISNGKFFLYEKSYFLSSQMASIIPKSATTGIHHGKVEIIICNLWGINAPPLLIRKILKLIRKIIPILNPTKPENMIIDPAAKYHLGFILILPVFIWEIILV